MGKMNIAIIALGSATVAFLLGLGMALLTERSTGQRTADTPEKNLESRRPATGDQKRVAPTDSLDNTPPSENGLNWEGLGVLSRTAGSNSRFHSFVNTMLSEGAWDGRNWLIGLVGARHIAYLNLFVSGEGKLFMEAIIDLDLDLDETMYVTLVFRPADVADLQAALANRNRKIIVTGRAMGLTERELDRLEDALLLFPLARPSGIKEGMLQFVGRMPDRVCRQFAQRLVYEMDEAAASRDQVDLRGYGPAVGIPLSERYVADMCFMPAEQARLQGRIDPELQFGPWWSVAIYSARRAGLTQLPGGRNSIDSGTISWPRLTLPEVDALSQ